MRLTLAALVAAATTSAQERRIPPVVYEAPPQGRQGLVGSVKLYERSHAVVIGIDQYQSASVPKLRGAVRDARDVAALLETQGFDVTLLVDAAATRRALGELLGDRLPTRLGKDDRVFVYFAGHGVSTGEGDTALGYLVPVDGDRERLRATGISMRELQDWFAGYPSKHVMFVADACYSGLALSTRAIGLPAGLSDYLKQVTSKPVRLAMTAGGSGEEAHEWRGHGLFTYFLLEALRGAADANHDGVLTSDEIAAYVRPNVSQTAAVQFRAQQNPQMGRHGEGEFVFLPGAPTLAENPAPSPAPGGTALEVAFWNSIAASNDARDFEEYLRKYPGGEFAGVARNRLERLRPPVPAALPALPALVPPGGAQIPGVKVKPEQLKLVQTRAAAQLASCNAGVSWDCVLVAYRHANGLGVPRDAGRSAAALQRACDTATGPLGPPHELLRQDEGVWDASVEAWTTRGAAPTVSRGVETDTLACGGRWLLSSFKGSFSAMPFEGHGLVTWDPVAMRFSNVWMDSMSIDLGVGNATYDAFAKTVNGWSEGPDAAGNPIKARFTMEYKDSNTRVYTAYEAGASETIWMRITYTRKP